MTTPVFWNAPSPEHAAPLTRYATRLLGDADRARDVVQDTFVKFMAQPVAAVDGHVVEWLFTVCRHRALDVLRKEGRVSRFAEGQAERVAAAEPRAARVGDGGNAGGAAGADRETAAEPARRLCGSNFRADFPTAKRSRGLRNCR